MKNKSCNNCKWDKLDNNGDECKPCFSVDTPMINFEEKSEDKDE